MRSLTKSPLAFVQVALESAREALPPYSHPKSPHKFTQHQLFAMLALKEFLQLDYRGLVQVLSEWSDLRSAMGLTRLPNFSTAELLDTQVRAGSPRSKRGFAALLEGTLRIAREHGLIGARIQSAAIDSTGYEAGHTSAYFARRSDCVKHEFPKLATICDIRSYLILAASASRGPWPDDPHFSPLVRRAHSRARFECLLADAGYDSEASHRLVREELGAKSVIPPTRGRQTTKPLKGRYRRMMKSRFPRKRYGQRWQIEATYSQDKRRFGSQIAASSTIGQYYEVLLRVLVHNIAILLRLNNGCFQQSKPGSI